MNITHFKRRPLVLLLSGLMTGTIMAWTPQTPAATENAEQVSDQALAQQLDAQAKDLIVAGDFAKALEKLEAAEIMMPDPQRAKRIERVRAFVTIRQGIPQPTAAPVVPEPRPATAVPAPVVTTPVVPKPAIKSPATPVVATPPAMAPTPAVANSNPPVNQSPEERQIRDFVDYLKRNMQMSAADDSGVHLKLDSEYSVVKKGGIYEVVLKPLTLTDESGDGMDIGPAVFHFKPKSKDSLEVSLALPDYMPLHDSGKTIAALSIGEQSMEGLWNSAYRLFDRVYVRGANMEMKSTEDPTRITLGEALYQQRMEYLGNKWQQTGFGSISNLSVEGYDSPKRKAIEMHLGGVSFDVAVGGRDIARMVEITQRIDASTENLMASGPEPDSKAMMAMFDDVKALFDLIDNSGFNLELKDLSVEPNGGGATQLAGMKVAGKMSFTDKGSDMHLNMGFHGLKTVDQQLPPQLVPDRFNFDLDLKNLPKYMEVFMDAAKGSVTEDELPNLLLGKLMQAQSRVALHDLSLHFPDFSIALKLDAKVDGASPYFSVGQADLNIINLPKMVELSKQMGASEGVSKMIVSVALASVRTETDGKVVDRFHLTWGQDGKVLLNGKDATTLISGNNAAAPTK